MYIKNNLNKILTELGIQKMVPTEQVRAEHLGGMTVHRFNKLLHNTGPNALEKGEEQLLLNWLTFLTGRPKESFQLMEEAPLAEEGQPC
ncbi:hypothetical protein ACFQT0_19660 [Hymenobacter humi]|uniref:DUF1456 family protein n=1 Tax=Hymenobacter humi TaxID=1411620 RepID=A0ABW2UB77_9BACT